MSALIPGYCIVPLFVYGGLFALLPWITGHTSWVRRLVIVMLGVLTLRYHFFRVTETLPLFEWSLLPLTQYVFYALEATMAFLSWQSMKVTVRRSDRSKDVEAQLDWHAARERPPLVAVLIPTFNENIAVLEPTILAACRLAYPRFRVWVLDDGKRDWLEARCRELGVGYMRRPDNRHYKAGNLNHAIRKLTASDVAPEFLVVLDADFIVLPQFIERTLALMKDDRVAIVQTPQFFYNPDPFQYAFNAYGTWPDDMRAFFEFRLPSLDAEGVATCCGTSFLARVAPVLQVGGFPSESVSEDTLLSIKLRGAGWRTVYLTEALSYGLAPEGLGEFLTQRARWWLGSTQTALYRWRTASGLALRTRFVAVEALLRCTLAPAFRLAWLVVPVVYWFTGFAILQASGPDIVSYVVPLWAARTALSWMSDGAILPIVTDAAHLVGAPLYLRAAFGAIVGSRNQSFAVTPKGINRNTLTIHWRVLSWMALFVLGIAGGVAYRAFNPRLSLISSRFLLWNLYSTYTTLAMLLVAITPCFERPKYRRLERFRYGEPVKVIRNGAEESATALDISLSGALLSGAPAPNVGEGFELELSPTLRVPGAVVRRLTATSFAAQLTPTPAQRSELIALIFFSGRYVVPPKRWTFWNCGVAMLRRAFA